MLDNPKGRNETMNTGVNPLALFEKCHGLFYVPTKTRDRELNVPSEGSRTCEVSDVIFHHVHKKGCLKISFSNKSFLF